MAKFLITAVSVLLMAVGIAGGSPIIKGSFESSEKNCQSDHVLNCVQTSGHHVYEEVQICPMGGEKFTALRLGTHSTYGRSLDWEPLSYMRFPVPLAVCPSNGFVITKEEYSAEELASLKRVIESKEYRELYSQKHASFFLYAKINELQGEKTDELWWFYLNATWEASLCKNDTRYKEYALAAISAGKKRIAELKETEELFWVLKIIVPNMYRRIGDFESAQKLIDELGTPALEDKGTNEFFVSAIRLLREAVKQKNTDRVPIRKEGSS